MRVEREEWPRGRGGGVKFCVRDKGAAVFYLGYIGWGFWDLSLGYRASGFWIEGLRRDLRDDRLLVHDLAAERRFVHLQRLRGSGGASSTSVCSG